MLAEHRVDDANESLIAIEKPMPSGEQITLEPTLALVLTEHRVQHASSGREEFIIFYFASVPLTVGDFKNRAQQIRKCLIGTEHAEITLVLIQLGYIAQKLARARAYPVR